MARSENRAGEGARMSFVKLEKRFTPASTVSGVSVSFKPRSKDGKRPMCIIGLQHPFLRRAGEVFLAAIRYDVAVGEGEHDGQIEIRPNVDGIFAPRRARQAQILDLGHLPQFGSRRHNRRPAAVEVIDGAAIITLPSFDDDEDGDEDRAEAVDVVISAPAKVIPVVKQERAKTSPARALTYEHAELTVDLTPNEESVTRHGHIEAVSPRGAKLVAALAKAMPNCVADKFLIGKLWDVAPGNASALLEMVIADLKVLKGIGLEIRTHRGVGRQLVVLG
jgi:hypothetical protein